MVGQGSKDCVATLVERKTGQETGSAELTSGAPSLGMTFNQPVVGYRIASQMDARGAGS